MSEKDKLHLVTQDGQPYGSVRRCCEWCGVMAGPYELARTGNHWTDDAAEYAASPERCSPA